MMSRRREVGIFAKDKWFSDNYSQLYFYTDLKLGRKASLVYRKAEAVCYRLIGPDSAVNWKSEKQESKREN